MTWVTLHVSKGRIYGLLFVGLALVLVLALIMALSAGSSDRHVKGDVMLIARGVEKSASCTFLSDSELKNMDFCKDERLLEVSHAKKCNDTVDESSTLGAPKVTYKSASDNDLYVLLMVDPDAPSDASQYFLHWAVTDIKGSALKDNSNGTNIIDYMGPAPPSGTHRYQFLLFKKSKSPETEFSSKSQPRPDFNLAEFIKDSKLCDLKATFQYRVNADS